MLQELTKARQVQVTLAEVPRTDCNDKTAAKRACPDSRDKRSHKLVNQFFAIRIKARVARAKNWATKGINTPRRSDVLPKARECILDISTCGLSHFVNVHGRDGDEISTLPLNLDRGDLSNFVPLKFAVRFLLRANRCGLDSLNGVSDIPIKLFS